MAAPSTPGGIAPQQRRILNAGFLLGALVVALLSSADVTSAEPVATDAADGGSGNPHAHRLLVIGDAVTTGVTPNKLPGLEAGAASYRRELQRLLGDAHLPIRFVGPTVTSQGGGFPPRFAEFDLNYAGGWGLTLETLLAGGALERWIKAHRPTCVLLQLGGNDLGRAVLDAAANDSGGSGGDDDAAYPDDVDPAIVARIVRLVQLATRQIAKLAPGADIFVATLIPVDAERHAHGAYVAATNAALGDAFPRVPPRGRRVRLVHADVGFSAPTHLLDASGIVPNPAGEAVIARNVFDALHAVYGTDRLPSPSSGVARHQRQAAEQATGSASSQRTTTTTAAAPNNKKLPPWVSYTIGALGIIALGLFSYAWASSAGNRGTHVRASAAEIARLKAEQEAAAQRRKEKPLRHRVGTPLASGKPTRAAADAQRAALGLLPPTPTARSTPSMSRSDSGAAGTGPAAAGTAQPAARGRAH